MKPLLIALLFINLFACSPYKKITLSASDRLIKLWGGATEQAVKESVGPYKQKSPTEDGYLLRFDYSYINVEALKKSNGFQMKASNQPNSIMVPRTDDNNNHRSAEDSVIMRWIFISIKHSM
jgi:hypothetical protein